MTKYEEFMEALLTWTDDSMQRSWRGWSHFAKSSGLSMQQFSILMQLHYRRNCSVSDISDRFEITNPAASQLVEKLVQSGYLDREEDPSDRRAKLITLSRKGKAFIARGNDQQYLWLNELATGLSAPDREKGTDFLRALIEAARKFDPVRQ